MSCLPADGAAIALAAAERPEDPVPSCPGWTMVDLADHVAGALAFARLSLLADDGVRPARPTAVGPLATELARLLDVLDAVDPAAVRPTFLGPRPASWWTRRTHQEAAVHRVDAYPGVDPTWISPACAVEGIGEYYDLASAASDAPVRLEATDADGSFGGIGRGDAEVVVVTGRAVDLLLLLWRRRSLDDGFTVRGDPRIYGETLGSISL